MFQVTTLDLNNVPKTADIRYLFVINKNRADIKKELDEGMRQLEEDDPFFLADLYKQYFLLT